MVSRLGLAYDLKNIIDLVRYLLPTPPVPSFMRRKMLALGSGDPTRAICTTLIAQAFQSVRYPILPRVETLSAESSRRCRHGVREILHIRYHSLFAPRDFDVSPYFQVVKPLVEGGFDYRKPDLGGRGGLRWRILKSDDQKLAVCEGSAVGERCTTESVREWAPLRGITYAIPAREGVTLWRRRWPR